MAEDWSLDVKKHAPDADDGVISGIVRYCGIALHNRDSSLVSFGDKTETNRVRENFLKKKLGLTDSDETLDGIIAKVGERLKGDRTKNRVTAYYLLAEEAGKLALFQKAGTVKNVDLPASPSIAPPVVAAPETPAPEADPVASIPTPQTTAPIADAPSAAPPVEDVPSASTPTPAVPVAPAIAEIKTNVAPAPAEPPSRPVPPAPAITAIEEGVSSIGDAAKDGAAKVSDTAKAGVAAVGAGLAGAGAAAGIGNGSGHDPAAHPAVDVPPLTGTDRAVDDAPPVLPPRTVHVDPVEEKKSGFGWLLWLLLGLLLLGLLWYLFGRSPEPAPPPPSEVTAPVEAPVTSPADNTTAAVTIPTGAGVTTETRDGKPAVIVYFDTAKSAVAPAFSPAAATLKTYLDAHAGSKIAVSGFNDPRGDAAMNAKLSKDRAEAVKAALVKAGIGGDTVELVKPAASTDTDTSNANARRVEVVVQ